MSINEPSTMISDQEVPHLSLLSLCDELLLNILAFLELPDLVACSRTCHVLRPLTSDPILHRNRLLSASLCLLHSLPKRPPLASLRPPVATIYLTPTLIAARKISRSLICIRLTRQLSKRPSVGSLVESNILPEEYFCFVAGKEKGSDGGGVGYVVSPALVGTKKGLEKERIKDRLRSWLSGRRKEELEKRQREEVERSVKGLVRRFAGRTKGMETVHERMFRGTERESRWGREAVVGEKRKRGEPTRAHVLGLRRFWEGMSMAAAKP